MKHKGVWTKEDNDLYNESVRNFYDSMVSEYKTSIKDAKHEVELADEEHLDSALSKQADYEAGFISDSQNYYAYVSQVLNLPWNKVKTEDDFKPGITAETLNHINDGNMLAEYYDELYGKSDSFENVLARSEQVGKPKPLAKTVPTKIADIAEKYEQPTLFDLDELDY